MIRTGNAKPKILWVDEDARALASGHRAILARHPEWQVSWVNNFERAIRIVDTNSVDVLITESLVNGLLGSRFLSWFYRHQSGSIALVVTARPDLVRRRTLPPNVQRVLLKPTDGDVLIGCIERALRARSVAETRVDVAPAASERRVARPAPPSVERRAVGYRSAIASHAPLHAVARVTRKVG